MRLHLAQLLSAMSLFSLLGCSRTTQNLPDQLTDLRVNIEAEHSTTLSDGRSYTHQSIRAVLSNTKGADIERNDAHIEVNGVRMRFRVSRGNYYDRHPYYLLDDDDRLRLTPAADYHFVLILPTGARHDIGTLRMPAALTPEQFDFAKQSSLQARRKIQMEMEFAKTE